MFARYSRTTKSLRRLFLDEFAEDVEPGGTDSNAGAARAEKLYDRVFVEYGDDSIAQLGGVHLACEQASQLLCKALEWGRLAAYLEQSTRYMRYDDRPGGRWRASVPDELAGTRLDARYEAFLDEVFGPTAGCTNRWTRTTAPGSRRTPPTPTSCIGRRSWPRRATRCGCCCRRARAPTWASTPPVSRTSSC